MVSKQFNNKALVAFAELMIEKINQVSSNWQKPWINASAAGVPRNAITGRAYNGLNDLMLLLMTEKYGYKLPAFLTYDQAAKAGSFVKKGEKSFPVLFWMPTYQDMNDPKKYIKKEEYQKLTTEEQANYKERLMLKDYNVFNIEQTNIKEDHPEIWKKTEDAFNVQKFKDDNGMYQHNGIDAMLFNNSWVCAIRVEESNRAFYSPSTDSIKTPLKAQFKDGESFYSTLLHEMAHSTGHETRLNRLKGGFFGDEKYAKEELVAEMTAALTGASAGMATTIREENAQYLKNWLETFKAEPNFILTLLSDVHKASNMIHEHIGLDVKEEVKTAITKGDKQEDFTPVAVTQTAGEVNI
jgi:antirestriction protein ArdC